MKLNLKLYRKKIKKIIYTVSNKLIKDLSFSIFKSLLFKRNLWKVFKKDKELKYLSIYFFMFGQELNCSKKNNSEKVFEMFIFYYFSNFIIKKKKLNKNIKFAFKYFKKYKMNKIIQFFKKYGLIFSKNIPEFDKKIYVNWESFVTEKTFVFANFFKLLVCTLEIKDLNNNKFIENGYKLGFVLSMCTLLSIKRKKHNFGFLYSYNLKKAIKKTDLFFSKLFFWTILLDLLRFFIPHKNNIFMRQLNKELFN